MLEIPSISHIECPFCCEEIVRPTKAITATCPNCGKTIALDSRVFNQKYVFSGEILTRGNISVGEKGFVKGDLSATDIVIEGIVEGNVKAVGRILLSQSGSLIGNAEARRLVVSEGATLSGNLKIGLKSNKEKNG
jgi:cytoskeletal protein CcmA (bactofilin family)